MSEKRDEYNRAGLLAFTFTMAFCISFFAYLVFIHKGVDLAENIVDPSAVKAESSAPAFDIAQVKEPWVSTPELVTYGAKVFKANCAMCHGDKGLGDGAAGAALNPKPRNFVEGKWTQGEGVINHFKVLQNGIAGSSMASYSSLKAADRWALLAFIESITQNKSKDEAAQVADFAKTAQ